MGVSNYDEGEVQINLFQDPSVQYNIFSETVKTYKNGIRSFFSLLASSYELGGIGLWNIAVCFQLSPSFDRRDPRC